MVNILSDADKNTLANAIGRAETQTSADIILVIAPASDSYYSYAILYGLLLGSLLDFALPHVAHLGHSALVLLCLQLISIVLMVEIPPLRRLATHLTPKKLRSIRAAQQAAKEYVAVSQQSPASAPFVLIFVSMAERIAHITGNRTVLEKLAAAQWEESAQNLTSLIAAQGLCHACVSTIQAMATQLASLFPYHGERHNFADAVILAQPDA